jgi:ferredoxin
VQGRLDVAALRGRLSFDDYDFYLCGPPSFMQQTYDALRDLNIADDRIRAEAFGPSSLQRRVNAQAGRTSSGPSLPASKADVPVTFVRSGIHTVWSPGSGSLLELAERSGLAPEFGCRKGTCGTCRTAIVGGAVAYPGLAAAVHDDGGALICCSVPAARRGSDGALMLDC